MEETRNSQYYEGKEVDQGQYNIEYKYDENVEYVECAREKAEIRILLKTVKPTNEQSRTVKKIGEEICVYLGKFPPEKSTFIMDVLQEVKEQLIDMETRKGTNEDVRRMLIIRKKTVITGVRG